MKFMKYFTLLAAAAGLVSACTTDLEHVQTLPDGEVVAPVLHELAVSEVVITSQNQSEVIAISWDAAYFGEQINPAYTLFASNDEREVSVVAGVAATKIDLTYEQLNLAVARPVEENGLGLAIGVASDIKLRIGARVGTNGKFFYTDYATLTVTPASFEKTYPMIYMPGSYQGWNPGNAATNYQVLYSFAANAVFEGIADFGKAEDASREWKFTKDANWDFDWGVAKGGEQTAEPATLTLINNDGGERDNIKAFTAKRFYHFTFDTTSGVLTNNYSFNQVGVVGDFNGWGNDAVMEFNAYKRRFYVDVENLSGGFKFRADADWALNWGVKDGAVATGGDNISCETAGNYRVYLYISDSKDMRYELDAEMYGQDEPLTPGNTTPDTPDTPAEKEPNRWGIVGTPNEWSKDGALADLYMDEVGDNLFVRRSLALTTADQFKIRFNDEWNDAKNYGLEAEGVVEPNVGFAVITSGESKNIKISTDGTYDVYFDVTAEKVWIMTEGETPSDVTLKTIKLYVDVTATGWTNCNIWAWDDSGANYSGGNWPGQALTLEDGKYVWEAPAEAVGKTISVIFNNGTEQTGDITGVVLDQDHVFVVAADMKVTIDGEAPAPPTPSGVKLYVDVTAPGWTNCNIWAWDDSNTNYSGGVWPGQALTLEDGKYVWVVPETAAGKTISVIFNNGTAQTADITGVVLDQDHTFVLDADLNWTMDGAQPEPEVVTFYVDVTATGWTNCNIWAWDDSANYSGGNWPGQALTLEDGKYVWVVPAEAVGKTINVIFNNGSAQTADITGIDASKSHQFVLDADKNVTIDGVGAIAFTDYAWALAGTFNSWGNLDMAVVDGWATATVDFAAGEQFKVKATSTWDVSFGHAEDNQNVVVGSEFELTFNGKNMFVENAGKYNVAFTIVDGKAKMKVEAAN